MSTIWRAVNRKFGWAVHFANHRDLNAFLFHIGASNYEVDRLEYSKKQDIIEMLNGSAMLGYMNAQKRGRKDIVNKEQEKQ
jgi:hypothetical protein